jgi:oligoribonuclease (3'-5' exoribonuclease)
VDTVAEADRLDPNKLWLWLDFETSDLNVRDLTVLEFGWTVTDRDLTQLIPVRSRLCSFAAPNSETGEITPRDPSWDSVVHEAVYRMHMDSGLTKEYRLAPEWSIVGSMGVIDQFVMDDLFRAGWNGSDQVVFAGSGIAAFDRSLLKSFRSRLDHLAHYRSADVSVALEVLGFPVPKSPEQFDDLITQITFGTLVPDVAAMEFEDKDASSSPHRAGGDVARSLMLARVLRLRDSMIRQSRGGMV